MYGKAVVFGRSWSVELPLGIFEEITGLGNLPAPVDQADYDRRKNQRAPFGFRGIISHEKKGGEQVSSVVMVRDISLGGLSFLNEEPLKPGTLFVMEFKGVDDRAVQIRCSVQRCATGGLEGTENIVGATFEELLTKELERPKAEAKPEAPPAEAVAQPIGEDAAAKPVAGEDPAAKEPAAQQADPAANPAQEPAPATPATPTEAAPVANAPAAPAANAPAAPADAAAPKAKSSLFSGAAIPVPKKTSDDFPSEDEIGAPKAAAKTAPPPEDAGPVFRDVPLPDPAPAANSSSSDLSDQGDSDSHDSESSESDLDDSESNDSESSSPAASDSIRLPVGGSGKTQTVLMRVKELLVKQEQTIKKQAEQLKKQRDHASKEVEKLRRDVADMKQQIAELRNRTQADDQAMSDLAAFLDQHGSTEGGDNNKKSEAA
jgi:hypothetical protein